MTALVFLEPNKIGTEPFTTSDVIAEFAEMNHRRVKDAIRKHETELNTFGKVGAYQTTLPSGQTATGYILNEQQSTLLITFLKNTPVVVAFKVELVRQFYAMHEEQMRRRVMRMELKPVRLELTDAIKEKDPGSWSYKKYTDLAYKITVGMNAAQLRKERGAPKKAVAVDYMTADEIAAVTKRQFPIGTLLDLGMSDEQIKAVLLNQAIATHTA